MSLSSVIILIYQSIVILTIIRILMDNKQPAKTIAWVMVIYFVPVVGLIVYLLFGVDTRRKRMASRHSMDLLTKRSMLSFVEQTNLQLPEQQQPLIKLFVNQSFSLPFNHNKIDILTSGYSFFPALLEDISKARDHIHIVVYIFEDDALGQLVADALIDKVRQGVRVRIVYDDVGCWGVKHRFFERMREEGIEIEPFMPVRFPSFASKVNYRNHRKLFIIDGKVGYIGGMNIALRYVKGRHGRGWRDTMLRIEGQGVYSLQRVFLIDWYFVDRTLFSDRRFYPEFRDETLATYAKTLLQTVTSAPLAPYPEIMQGFTRIILSARSYIYIESPYFLPTDAVFFALKTAVASGVDVRILVPRKTDGWFAEWGCRSYLREAQHAGIHILLYEPRFLHSKLLVCDDSVCTCGSTNLDFRSLLNNYEANAFIYDEDVARRMRNIFLEDASEATALTTLRERMKPAFPQRLAESLARLLSPLL